MDKISLELGYLAIHLTVKINKWNISEGNYLGKLA